MNLPKEISPNPLVSATVEIRFKTDASTDSLLSDIYPIFIDEYKDFIDALTFDKITDISVADPDYAYEYIFRNDKYSISIGKNVIAFENLNGYHFWSNYEKTIIDNVSKFDSKIKLDTIKRVGVRYVSILEGVNDISSALKYSYNFSLEEIPQQRAFFRVNYAKDDIRIVTQVGQQVRVEKDKLQKRGLLVDIEAFRSFSDEGTKIDIDKLFSIISELHSVEKTVFFSMLNDDYLKANLNPIY